MSRAIKSETIGGVIEDYSNLIHSFQFEKARTTVDSFRYKHASFVDQPQDAAWLALLQGLGQLSEVERNYLNLNFLQPKGKGFFRRDNSLEQFQNNYNQIRNDLARATQILKSDLAAENLTTESLAEHLLTQFQSYVSARIDMMQFYTKLAGLATPKAIGIGKIIEILTEIQEKYKISFHHPEIDPIRTGFQNEVDILFNLMQCQNGLSKLQFLESLTFLQSAQSILKSWLGSSPKDPKTQAAWFGLGPSSKQSSLVHLCVWLREFYECLLSKFTLYFFDILSRQTSTVEMKSQLSSGPAGYFVHKICSFQKKYDAAYVLIFMDAQDRNSFHELGYRHPEKGPGEPLRGLESCPAIFSQPALAPNSGLLPGLVMLLNDNFGGEQWSQRTAYMYDTRKSCTYYMTPIEEDLYLALVFEEKKQEKNSAVVNFLAEILPELKCLRVFGALKMAGK